MHFPKRYPKGFVGPQLPRQIYLYRKPYTHETAGFVVRMRTDDGYMHTKLFQFGRHNCLQQALKYRNELSTPYCINIERPIHAYMTCSGSYIYLAFKVSTKAGTKTFGINKYGYLAAWNRAVAELIADDPINTAVHAWLINDPVSPNEFRAKWQLLHLQRRTSLDWPEFKELLTRHEATTENQRELSALLSGMHKHIPTKALGYPSQVRLA